MFRTLLLAVLLLGVWQQSALAFNYTNNIGITVKFNDTRFQNAPDDLLDDPVNGLTPLKHAKIQFECDGEIYAHTTSTNDNGYAFHSFETYGGRPDWCYAIIELRDRNDPAHPRWLVTDDTEQEWGDYRVTPVFSTPTCGDGLCIWNLGTYTYAGGAGESSERAGLFHTADHFYHTVVEPTPLLMDRYGLPRNYVNPDEGGIGILYLRLDSSYEGDKDHHCGLAACSESGNEDVKIKPTCQKENDRAFHELGHITMCLALKDSNGYPGFMPSGTGGGTRWDILSTGWGSRAFSEGWANFVALVARWPKNHSNPVYRPGVNPYYEEEPPSGDMCYEAGSSIQEFMFRHEHNITRYLWDLYDTHADTSGFNRKLSGDPNYVDNKNIQFFTLVNEMASMRYETAGDLRYENRGVDERESQLSSGSSLDQPNIRDLWYELDQFFASIGYGDHRTWSTKMYYMNCMRVWEDDSTGAFGWIQTGHCPDCRNPADCPAGYPICLGNICLAP